MSKTLNVKITSIAELNDKWGFIPPGFSAFEAVYIRCNAKGEINWDGNTPIYKAKELIERDNVNII